MIMVTRRILHGESDYHVDRVQNDSFFDFALFPPIRNSLSFVTFITLIKKQGQDEAARSYDDDDDDI